MSPTKRPAQARKKLALTIRLPDSTRAKLRQHCLKRSAKEERHVTFNEAIIDLIGSHAH
jgi:hypothetical protein